MGPSRIPVSEQGKRGDPGQREEREGGLTFEEVADVGIVVDGVRDRHDHLDDFLGDRVVRGGLPSENDHPWHDLLQALCVLLAHQ